MGGNTWKVGILSVWKSGNHVWGSNSTTDSDSDFNPSGYIVQYRTCSQYLTRMHSSRMRTARSSSRPGGSRPGHSPLPPWTEWQTGVKILPCPKLRLWTVKIVHAIVKVEHSKCSVSRCDWTRRTYDKWINAGRASAWSHTVRQQQHDRSWSRLKPPPMLVRNCVDENSLAAMLIAKRWAGVSPEVNLRNPLHAGDKAHKWWIHHGFETQGGHHQRFKTGVSVAPHKGLIFSKKVFFLKW